MSVEQILAVIKSYNTTYVCLTGGEPLLQSDSYLLMQQLCDLNYNVSLETSGDIGCDRVDPRVLKIIDIKTPDSGEKDKFSAINLNLPSVNIEFKFVICSESDFDWSENFIAKHRLNAKYPVLYSPSFNKVTPQWLAEKILEKRSSARLQLQLHKYIWSHDTRGV
jgi:7-carboxy-7-deazaguanine synthase